MSEFPSSAKRYSPGETKHHDHITFVMPHATAPQENQDQIDDDLIQRTLNDENPFGAGENLFDRDLEPGEKADDAVDYADLSDDDLADDDAEEPNEPPKSATFNLKTVKEEAEPNVKIESDAIKEFDDLFGDELSPVEQDDGDLSLPFGSAEPQADTIDVQSPLDIPDTQGRSLSPGRALSFDLEEEALTRDEQLQRELFAMSKAGLGNADIISYPPENDEELLASLWPKFQRDTIPKFMDLLPAKKVRWLGKVPSRQPKPLQTTKLDLEIAQDDEKTFKSSHGPSKRTYEEIEGAGVIPIRAETSEDKKNDAGLEADSDFENEPVAGVTWQDMQILCADWDADSETLSALSGDKIMEEASTSDLPFSKRQKTDCSHRMSPKLEHNNGVQDSTLGPGTQFLQPGVLDHVLESSATFHDPENATARIAGKVILDLNDPYILIDDHVHATKRRRVLGPQTGSKGREGLSQAFVQKYNVSNDEAYDLLKENHQHKVRGTLGNVTIEHTLPAVRLQWPFVSQTTSWVS